jgi:multisubunit Na+/H+ antiporter MnhE subunit
MVFSILPELIRVSPWSSIIRRPFAALFFLLIVMIDVVIANIQVAYALSAVLWRVREPGLEL